TCQHLAQEARQEAGRPPGVNIPSSVRRARRGGASWPSAYPWVWALADPPLRNAAEEAQRATDEGGLVREETWDQLQLVDEVRLAVILEALARRLQQQVARPAEAACNHHTVGAEDRSP